MRYVLLQTIKNKGYTIQQVAQAVNVSQPFLTQIIKGYRNPSLEVALRISSYLDSNVESLFNDLVNDSIQKSKGVQIKCIHNCV